MTRQPPAVLVWHHGAPPGSLRAVAAGLEEEGVPYLTEHHEGEAVALADAAARASNLGVGVGIGADGAVCAQQAKLPARAPAALERAEHARLVGHNAARLVVGIPFKRKESP